MKTAAIIVAAGRGTRAGGPLPKQWQTIAGRTVMAHALAAFETPSIAQIVLVLHPDDHELRHGFEAKGHIVVTGGQDRAQSVRNGLEALADQGIDHVLIHDVARPCVSARTISDVMQALVSAPAAAPALPVTDALWTGQDNAVTGTQARDGLFRAQTPQGFHYGAILAAHRAHAGGASDDVEVARAAGIPVTIVPGDERNLKITTPEDFARAEALLRPALDIRLGNGFDVHKFGTGDHVVLCGVQVPHDAGLVGHSDADVGMHAVTDAIYGALARGDIGRHFPPSDPQWKGASSDIFLIHAVQLAAELGYRISNVDCTMVCEFPKIGPHAAHMQEVMSGIMALSPDQVSIKATTSETLGFTGRGEGIAALATVTLVAA